MEGCRSPSAPYPKLDRSAFEEGVTVRQMRMLAAFQIKRVTHYTGLPL